ncbi:MAG TPA: hypothetical protein VFQ53_41005 [Kofleriaceae bacterium]|nr:hypothetical protein [Kofleriaceae bacterium]
MLRLGLIAIVVGGAGALAAAAFASPPPGKVVRVERRRASAATVPGICEVQPSLQGICVGSPPKVGDVVTVVDETQTVAEVRVKTARATTPKCESVWTIEAELVRGDISQTSRRKSIGIIDPALDRRVARKIDESKIEVPNSEPDHRVAIGVDRDDDGAADIVLTQSRCGSDGECLDIWTPRSGALPAGAPRAWNRVWTANIQPCF